jgi:hypothetical protein
MIFKAKSRWAFGGGCANKFMAFHGNQNAKI